MCILWSFFKIQYEYQHMPSAFQVVWKPYHQEFVQDGKHKFLYSPIKIFQSCLFGGVVLFL